MRCQCVGVVDGVDGAYYYDCNLYCRRHKSGWWQALATGHRGIVPRISVAACMRLAA